MTERRHRWQLALLNLQRNQCIDQIDWAFRDLISKTSRRKG